MRSFTQLLAGAGLLAQSALALNTIEVKNQEFIDSSTGDRLVIIGIDYQPGGSAGYGTGNGDPLSNPKDCLRDAALMQQLGINTIRSYNVDPTLNHDECVSIFNSVGIYMLIDVNSPLPGQAIAADDPGPSYNLDYLKHIFAVVEAFKNYDNLIGFFAGNEVINTVATGSTTPPYIRAVQRDLKNYIAKNSDRQIPVGYSAAQVQSVLHDTWAYLQCTISSGSGENSNSDFFGLNSYSWCGNASSFTTSKYDVLVDWFGSSAIPVFFSEYGCNDPSPRYFNEIPTLFGPKMTSISGGLAYQWTQDTNNYGLVQVNSNGSAELLFDYYTFAEQLSSVDVSLLTKANSTAESLTAPSCSSSLISNDGFSKSFNIPNPPNGADDLISNGISNPPTGTMVDVTTTTVAYPVYGSDGARLQNLAITPGASTQNTPDGSSSSSSGDSSDNNDSGAVGGVRWVWLNAVAVGVVGMVAFLL